MVVSKSDRLICNRERGSVASEKLSVGPASVYITLVACPAPYHRTHLFSRLLNYSLLSILLDNVFFGASVSQAKARLVS